MSTTVKYNGTEISPPPFFSRTTEAIDYGSRWGLIQNITLDGVITDTVGTGRLTSLNSIFSESFKDLVVESNDEEFYRASNCVLENISFGNHLLPHNSDAAVPYTVKMKSYDVPSGVIDVSSEFSYQENEDGTVSVDHKTSAKGIKTNIDAIVNAYNFVSLFTGVNPLSVALPVLTNYRIVGSHLDPATQAVLLSVDENVDRLEGTYTVSEKWKYETGSSNNYFSTFSLSVEDDISQEFVTLNLSANFKGPVTGGVEPHQGLSHGHGSSPLPPSHPPWVGDGSPEERIAGTRAAAAGFDYYDKLSDFGIKVGACVLNSFTATENPDSNSVSLNVNFFSGNLQGVSGIFNNSITMDWDEVKNIKTYSVNSEFQVQGPRDFKDKRIGTIKEEIINDYDHYAAYLYHIIKDSAIYNEFGTDRDLNPLPIDLSINEGETSPSFSLTASFDDSDYLKIETATLGNGKDYPISAGEAEWSVDVVPEKWIFSIQKSANIEGHLIVQDMQCRTRERISFDLSIEHIGNSLEDGDDVNPDESLDKITVFAKAIEDDIVTLASEVEPGSTQRLYLTDESVSSGEHSFSIGRQNIAKDPIDRPLSEDKFYDFNAGAYNTRDAGHQYGF